MVRSSCVVVLIAALVLSSAALAESVASMPEVPGDEVAAFDPASQHLREQSFTRSCDEFNAYLKKFPAGALVREAKVKRAMACSRVGRVTGEMNTELRAVAGPGPLDYPRALANAWLTQMGERWTNEGDRAKRALDQLGAVSAKAGGRWAQEARTHYFSLVFSELDNGNGSIDELVARILSANPTSAETDHALFIRGQRGLYNGENVKRAEKDLLGVGQGNSEWADDALYALGQWHENKGEFVPALALYQQVVDRFSPTTSNQRGNAESRIADIKRPSLSVSDPYVEWPGEKVRLSISFRNVTEAKISITRADPLHADAQKLLGGDEAAQAGAPGEVAKSWTESLKAPSQYAPGNKEVSLALDTGSYGFVATAGAQRSVGSILVTGLSSTLKVGGGRAAVWTVDAFSGKAVPQAEVALYARGDSQQGYRRLEGVSDASGLCLFELGGGRNYEVFAWSGKGTSFTRASGYSGWRDPGEGELLAYALTDRPLFKPGEKVGIKVLVRERKGGPSEAAPNIAVEARVNDASGREVDKRVLTTNAFGTASYELALGRDAQLGAYTLYVYAHGGRSIRSDQGRFRVEEYKPPEYTVKVEPVGKPKPGEIAKVKVSAAFFFGGPVANAQGRAIVSENAWAHAWTPWGDEPLQGQAYDEYGNYYGGYEEKRYQPWYGSYQIAPQRTLTFKTDAAGTAILEIPPSKGTQPGDRSFAVQVFVTDASRREVTGSGTINLSATPYFLDLRADRLIYKPGERIKVQLRAEDANGNAESPALDVRLVRLDEKGASGEVLKKPVALAGGRGEVLLDADALGPVRIEARASGSAAGEPLASTDVWLTNEAKPIVPPQAGFLLLTDRTPLKVGGTVRALVVTPKQGGHVLVTLEGDKLWAAQSLEVMGRARFVELPLTGDMAPNVFLSVARLEEGTFYATAFGIRVSGSSTALDVAVKLPTGKTEPGAQIPVSVTLGGQSPAGAAAEISVSLVDEAIYAIEPEREDLLSFFGQRAQQQAVQTQASVQQRAFRPRQQPQAQPDSNKGEDKEKHASGADMDRLAQAPPASKAAIAAGPAPAEEASKMRAEKKSMAKDEAAPASAPAPSEPPGGSAAAPPVKARTNFSSSGGWFPEIAAKVGSPSTVKAKLPDSLTTWRVTAVATTAGPWLGVGKGTLRTEKPLMVRLQGPRFFTERDEVTLSAIVTSRMDKKATVDVSFEAPGLKALDPPAKKVEVAPGGEARVDVRWLVTDPGDRVVKVTARGGGEADAMEWTLPAVVHGAAQRASFAGRLSEKFSFKVNLPEKRNPLGTRLELTASPSVLGVMLDALPFLAHYPYGCVEQTLSRFVPAAIAAKIVNRLGATSPRVPQDLNDMVDVGLKRLYGFQHGDGGWGWWQTDATNRWMSAYAVYGLWLGKEAGLKVDESVLQRGRQYLKSHLGAARANPDEHAFMIFSLAQTGGAPKAAVDQAFAVRTRLSNRGRALLALALEAQNDPRARIAVENLDDIVKAAQARADASVGEANDVWETSAAIEATAYTLMAVYRHDPNATLVKPLTDFLVLRRNGGKWHNTRDTAFALYALADIAMKEESSASNGTILVTVNGKEAARMPYKRGGLEMAGPIVLADSAFSPGENVVEVRRDGKGTGYWAAMFDVYNQDENVKGVGGDVKIARHYTIVGRPGAEKAASSMEYGMALESGERVRVDLDVSANKAVEFVMIEDLKPAGMETVLQKSGPEVCNHACAHAELRTDRVAMFMSDIRVGTTHLSYELRAEVPGKFHGLPARVEAMYAPEIKATSDEIRLEIRDAAQADKGVATGQ